MKLRWCWWGGREGGRAGGEQKRGHSGTAGHCVGTPGTGRHIQIYSLIHTLTRACTRARASAHCHTDIQWHLGGQPPSPVHCWVLKLTVPLHHLTLTRARPSEALFLGSPWGNKVNTLGVSVQERRSLKNEKEDEDLWTTSKGRRE